ncbi:MAG: YtxH domain-containing protein [Microbacteriaceae bacterium]|nr:YtxH domain-containing protein [Microbacteriaceae bacterium]
MRGKILLVLGLGIGYVLGTRDGRARYNQMKSAALKVWNDPRVQEQVNAATEFVKENAPEVASAVTENVRKIAQRVEAARSGKAPAKSATPARKPAAKPASKKTTPSAPTNTAKK